MGLLQLIKAAYNVAQNYFHFAYYLGLYINLA